MTQGHNAIMLMLVTLEIAFDAYPEKIDVCKHADDSSSHPAALPH